MTLLKTNIARDEVHLPEGWGLCGPDRYPLGHGVVVIHDEGGLIVGEITTALRVVKGRWVASWINPRAGWADPRVLGSFQGSAQACIDWLAKAVEWSRKGV